MDNETSIDRNELLALTAEIVSAYVGNNALDTGTVPDVIGAVFAKLTELSTDEKPLPEALTPAVPIKRSVTDDYIVCLEDGKKLKMLKRHLKTAYNLTPEQYRERWGLGADYPMVAPNYAKHRSSLAKKIWQGAGPRGGRPAKARGAAKTDKAE